MRTVFGLRAHNLPGRGYGLSNGVAEYDVDVAEHAWLAEFLCGSTAWQPRAHMVERLVRLAPMSEASAQSVVDEMRRVGILVGEEDGQTLKAARAQDTWEAGGWGPALFFHAVTNQMPRMNYAADGVRQDNQMMLDAVSAEPTPDNYKELPWAERVPLLANGWAEDGATLGEVMSRYDLTAPASQPSWSLGDFSRFLKLTLGQIRQRRMPVTRAHVGRTSPSGGSRHPSEAYVFVHRVDDVEAGLYHYSVKSHVLELMKPGEHWSFVHEHIVGHDSLPTFDPCFSIVFSSIFERSMFRYREPFSYRVMSHDIGHLFQTIRMAAQALHRRVHHCYSIDDSETEAMLGLSDLHESAMAATVVG